MSSTFLNNVKYHVDVYCHASYSIVCEARQCEANQWLFWKFCEQGYINFCREGRLDEGILLMLFWVPPPSGGKAGHTPLLPCICVVVVVLFGCVGCTWDMSPTPTYPLPLPYPVTYTNLCYVFDIALLWGVLITIGIRLYWSHSLALSRAILGQNRAYYDLIGILFL